MNAISNVVLVHGAWADGSSWAKVIPLLAREGKAVVAVQLSLTSFESDVAAVRRAIGLVDGEMVLVGHSYAGAVITEAGSEPKVVRLVYVDAFAPDVGESAGSLFAQFQSAPLGAELRPDPEGFLKISRDGIFNFFAQDLTDDEKMVVYATQGPINGGALNGAVTKAAWQDRPTFYLIGDQDHAVPRAEQERMAARMKATICHADSSHVPMLSRPEAVADFILRAAK